MRNFSTCSVAVLSCLPSWYQMCTDLICINIHVSLRNSSLNMTHIAHVSCIYWQTHNNTSCMTHVRTFHFPCPLCNDAYFQPVVFSFLLSTYTMYLTRFIFVHYVVHYIMYFNLRFVCCLSCILIVLHQSIVSKNN